MGQAGRRLNVTDDGVNDGVKLEVAKVILLVLEKEGRNAREITEMMSKSKPTIERYLRIARVADLIEFKGAPKTGGYYLTGKVRELLKRHS